MGRVSPILDSSGNNMVIKDPPPRRDLRASYDAARTTNEFKNYWANADRFDADSAHSKDVRHTLISRSRYELANNGYADGIAQTYCTDLVGVGPMLRMQTGSQSFNTMVEREWYFWTKAIGFRRKLWCMAHAKYGDGEGLAVMRRNKRVRHRVKLDIQLYEAEQCQTPFVPYDDPHYIDGIKFDEFGNPVWYDFLNEHPGMARGMVLDMTPERVPAELVLHWYKLRRPGQHRGVPESASTLNTGAAARRWREATIAAAETAADFSLLLKTGLNGNSDEAEAIDALETWDIAKRQMMALPVGYDAFQMKSEHPNAQYEAFHKTLINEQARPANMPYNKAACDSSAYNYASGRLDHQTYHGALDVDREDCSDRVLDPLFSLWFDLAIEAFGWLGGNSSSVSDGARFHLWDWPKHRVADVEAEANANQTKLKSGQISLHRLYADAGLDLDDEIPAMAETFGVKEDELRQRLFDVILPPPKQAAPAPARESSTEPEQEPTEQSAAFLLSKLESRALLPKVNGNGAHHG